MSSNDVSAYDSIENKADRHISMEIMMARMIIIEQKMIQENTNLIAFFTIYLGCQSIQSMIIGIQYCLFTVQVVFMVLDDLGVGSVEYVLFSKCRR